jgi:mitogen-activated protein kinase-activated protein kinase 2
MNEVAVKFPRSPKATPITDDYEISNTVLGLGINGKVVQCYTKKTREKHALKVKRRRC